MVRGQYDKVSPATQSCRYKCYRHLQPDGDHFSTSRTGLFRSKLKRKQFTALLMKANGDGLASQLGHIRPPLPAYRMAHCVAGNRQRVGLGKPGDWVPSAIQQFNTQGAETGVGIHHQAIS